MAEHAAPVGPEDVLGFWFGDALSSTQAARDRGRRWFARDDACDAEVRARFGAFPDRAADGQFDRWRDEPRPALAVTVVLDQFPRNLFRGSARAFAFDRQARAVAASAVAAGFDRRLRPLEAGFLYLPFEHAEDLAAQDRAVDLFERLADRAPAHLRADFEVFVDYARRHREVIRRFGRFPHRNAVLDRPSTPDEEAYLASGGERFGG